jgi:pimeloyl-ACP methyl ester carboxylesterase
VFATAIDLDAEDVDGPASFFDLDVEEGLALAVKKDLFVFDASSLALIATLDIPSDDAFRVSVARQVMTDLDGDGRDGLAENDDGDLIRVFEELKNLALVGGGSTGRLSFVDITEPHLPTVLGWLDTGAGAYRAVAVPQRGIAYLTTGSGIQVIDLTHPNHEGLWDPDGDGKDNRILADVPVAGAQDLRVDLGKGLAYVLQKGQGLAVVRLDSCDTDLGVDATRQQTPRRTRFSSKEQERAALLQGIESGKANDACQPFREKFALLAQGSSACIWSSTRSCSTAYQPGIADYDFELFVPEAQQAAAGPCALEIEKEIKKVNGLDGIDLSVFTESREQLEAGYRKVDPRGNDEDGHPSCGAGDDKYGDLCLGRTGLVLKWVLEGEWVHGYNDGLDLEHLIQTLRTPLPADAYSSPPPTSDLEPTHIVRLEGREWECLQDFALAKSFARIRVRYADLAKSEILDPSFVKKIHDAAKAGIRAVFGKLLATTEGNRLMLAATRADYDSPEGCLTGSSDPDTVADTSEITLKRCEGFEEYVASQAIRAVREGVRDASTGMPIFSEADALQAYEFYRRKADVGRQITEELDANEFITRTMQFLTRMKDDDVINDVYARTLDGFADASKRHANFDRCTQGITDYSPGGTNFKIKAPMRLFNDGYGVPFGSELVFYQDGVVKERREVTPPLTGGSEYFLKKDGERKLFSTKAQSGNAPHSLQFRLDPANDVTEYDKANNLDGFWYYVLDGRNAQPPATPNAKARPEPPSVDAPDEALPDPSASAICVDATHVAPSSPSIEVIALVDDQLDRAVDAGVSTTRSWVVRNTGNVTVQGLELHDSNAGTIAIEDLAAGASRVVSADSSYTPSADQTLLLTTLTGTDADGNGIGVASTQVRVTRVTARPPDKEPVILIPGVAGSVLSAGGREYWPGAGVLGGIDKRPLSLDPSQTDPPRVNATATDILRQVSVVGRVTEIYEPLLRALRNGGYPEYPIARVVSGQCQAGASDKLLFVFPYDWRHDNATHIVALDHLVDCVQHIHPGKRVHLMGHSMGGLIATRYALEHPDRIAKVITIGTPFLGAPKAINTLGTGDLLGGGQFLLVGDATLAKLARWFRGPHQLLPSRSYFDLGGRPFFVEPSATALDYAGYKRALDEQLFLPSMPAQATESFHTAAQDDRSTDMSYVRYFHVYGQQNRDTTVRDITQRRTFLQQVQSQPALSVGTGPPASASGGAANGVGTGGVWSRVAPDFSAREGPGDGTVPTLSATRKWMSNSGGPVQSASGNLNAPTARLWRVPRDGDDKLRDHNGMLTNPALHKYLLSVLEPWNPPPGVIPDEAAR